MFIPKSPPPIGFSQYRGRPKQIQKACEKGRQTYCSWYDLLLKKGHISAESAHVGERYSYMRNHVLRLQGFKPNYQRSTLFNSSPRGHYLARDWSLLQQQRLLKAWHFFEDILLAPDRRVLDFCTVEPFNYHLTDWQLKELGGKVHRALADVMRYKDNLWK